MFSSPQERGRGRKVQCHQSEPLCTAGGEQGWSWEEHGKPWLEGMIASISVPNAALRMSSG